jgi:hypothetical protein
MKNNEYEWKLDQILGIQIDDSARISHPAFAMQILDAHVNRRHLFNSLPFHELFFILHKFPRFAFTITEIEREILLMDSGYST